MEMDVAELDKIVKRCGALAIGLVGLKDPTERCLKTGG